MSFEISRGTPQFSGRYVCYMSAVSVATVIRLWIVGRGWADLLGIEVAGEVAGWIGPLPVFPENMLSRQPVREFDL